MLVLLSHPLPVIYRASAEQQAVAALAPGYSVGLRVQELLHYEGVQRRRQREMLSLVRWIHGQHVRVGVCAWRIMSKVQWRDWCWFIYGACVSCSSILCSIYSQYTFEDCDFIFIEIS